MNSRIQADKFCVALLLSAAISPSLIMAQTGKSDSSITTQVQSVASVAKQVTTHDLGTTTIGGLKMAVYQIGEVKTGEEVKVELLPESGQPMPEVIRVWLGPPSGEGSGKVRAEAMDVSYYATLKPNKKIDSKTLLWIEVDPATGKKAKSGIPMKH